MEGNLAVNVITLGTFDPLHVGHVGLFAQCRRIAGDGTVTVAVNSDGFVLNYRGKPAFMPENHRAGVIEALADVDTVIVNDELLGQAQLILDSGADCIVIGQDWATKDYMAQLRISQKWLDDHDIQLCYVPRTGEWSSTAIKARDAVGQ